MSMYAPDLSVEMDVCEKEKNRLLSFCTVTLCLSQKNMAALVSPPMFSLQEINLNRDMTHCRHSMIYKFYQSDIPV